MLSAVAIFVVTFLSVTVADDVCPDDWSSFQGSCYQVGQTLEGFSIAYFNCFFTDATLTEITSEEENEFVKGLLNRTFPNDGETKAYIGVRLIEHQGYSEWVSYESHRPQSFFDWVNPDWESDVDHYSRGQYVALMSKAENWSWVVGKGYVQQNYVCEKKGNTRSCNQGGSCYQLLPKTHHFLDIQDKCSEFGGNVLEINSQGEQDFVETFLSGEYIQESFMYGTQHVWLGARDYGSKGEFRWLSTQEKFDYTLWSDGEPKNTRANGFSADCVVLDYSSDFTWTATDCYGDHALVCEIPSTSGITG